MNPIPIIHALGSVRGRLEAVHTVGGTVFQIYPPGWPSAVECVFPDRLAAEAKNGLGLMVTVRGQLSYRPGSLMPFRVEGMAIDIHRPSQTPKTLGALRGIARPPPARISESVRRTDCGTDPESVVLPLHYSPLSNKEEAKR